MKTITQSDLNLLLDQTYYGWDTKTMLGDVIGFLEFSEANLTWQKRRELLRAEHEGKNTEFRLEDQHLAASYRGQLIEAVEYGFDVSLAQRVRYSGLVAFVTTMEWCAKLFSKRLKHESPSVPAGHNKHVHLFSYLNIESSSQFEKQIDDLKKLVHVRNCVVHASGFVEGYEFEKEVRETLGSLDGFSTWSENFLGTNIKIEKNAIEKFAEGAMAWVPQLDERCTAAGMFK